MIRLHHLQQPPPIGPETMTLRPPIGPETMTLRPPIGPETMTKTRETNEHSAQTRDNRKQQRAEKLL